LTDLLPRLTACAERRALVMSDAHLAGIVSPSDITRTVERSGRTFKLVHNGAPLAWPPTLARCCREAAVGDVPRRYLVAAGMWRNPAGAEVGS
jgi:hypothetical protein